LLHSQTIRTIPLKRTEHKTVDYLEDKEMQALLDALDLHSRTGVRDKALLLLLYNTGARVSEIVQLKVADLRLDDAAQVKLLGKGKKYRSCPLWPETLEALHDYLKQRTPKDPAAQQLFLNANGSPVTRFGVWRMSCSLGCTWPFGWLWARTSAAAPSFSAACMTRRG
jgi:site-specific recombinase XerD